MTRQATIVVGVDGSAGSRAALEFALDEAARRGAAVRVLWAIPELEYWPTAYGTSPSLFRELAAAAESAARVMLDEVVRDRGGALADVPVEFSAVGGSPAQVLTERSRGADLLVIGHRGRGAVRSAVLGSVGLQCVLHAPVPVTVVRAAAQDGDRAPSVGG